ncbi:MAG TPA: crosslink repair DNA glycosylase YcaQ family protein [Balneolales bacterium]|nr:crosslink repair DNA glycosylase YcaQ family protein [Balneolales bacterium]
MSTRRSETIDIRSARRLALACAGLLKPEWTGLPQQASGKGLRARKAAWQIINRFGYLQLDTVSIAGARSHAIVLMSRLEGFDPQLAEELLQPGEPIFEYWGHEASWLPMDLYPVMDFRRREFVEHPWWGDLVGKHPDIAERLRRRIRSEGPLRSLDMEGSGSSGWWNLKTTKRVATAMWSSGELAIRERRNFQRTYDLAENVIPDHHRETGVPEPEAIERLLLYALQGHGWATTGTLTQTWRLRNRQKQITAALHRLVEKGAIVHCALAREHGQKTTGWIRPGDLDLAEHLSRIRPRRDQGVLLSPFDPVLWDRNRVKLLFDFDQILEIFKPFPKRIYGYYCLPILAGERLIGRFDLKADRKTGILNVLSRHFEGPDAAKPESPADAEAARAALDRYANALKLKIKGW